MKAVFFAVLLISSAAATYSDNNISDWGVGDTVRVLTPQNSYRIRIYIFLDKSSCVVCQKNIPVLYEKFRDDTVEYVTFLNEFTQLEAETYRNEAGWEFPVVGDPYQIYRSYYRIRWLPALLVLDDNGVLQLCTSPSSPGVGDSIRAILKRNQRTQERIARELMQEWVLQVRTPKDQPLKSTFVRRLLATSDMQTFILINSLECAVRVVNRQGSVVKVVPVKLDTLHCMYIFDIAWMVQDSVVLIYGYTYEKRCYLALYRVGEDKLEQITYLPRYRWDVNLEYCDGDILLGIGYPSKEPRYLNERDTVAIALDARGRIQYTMKGPDSIYSHYLLSHWYGNACGCYRDAFLTLEQFSTVLKVWEKPGVLRKSIPVQLSTTYRIPNNDIPIDSPFKNRPIQHWISSLVYRHLLYDQSNDLILISYRNEEYPEGVIDYTDKRVKHSEYIHICRSDGKPIYPHDLYAGNHFIPHLFNRGTIIGTALDQNNNLLIVAYRLQLPKQTK